MSLRVIFMGTPAYAVPTLERLYSMDCAPVAVVSQPDRPVGRGQKLQQTPVAACATAHGTPIYQWAHLNNTSFNTLKALEPDLCVVVAYGRILPKRYLELPRFGCLNGHASLLPRWRGAAPIQWSIIAGDSETGISIMRMSEGMDEGDVGLVRRVPILPEETAGELQERLSLISADLMEEAIHALQKGELRFTPQDPSLATAAPPLQKSLGRIDFNQPAQKIDHLVRGVSPWPGSFVDQPEGPLKIHQVRVNKEESQHTPGVVIAHDPEGPRVACGEGSLTLLRLQRPGRRVVTGKEFLQSGLLPVGTAL